MIAFLELHKMHTAARTVSDLISKVEEQNLLIQGKNAFTRILDDQIATLQSENAKLNGEITTLTRYH